MENNDVGYKEIQPDFYEQQINSLNPIRTWLHTNRYFMVDMLIKANYSKGNKIVDFGCGDCNWNLSLLPVHGVDLNEGMLKFAQKKGRLVSYESSDFHHTSLEEQSVDIVVASEVVEHLQNPELLLNEIKRILKPTGKFVVSVPFDTATSLFRLLFSVQCFIHGYIFNDDYYKKQCGHVQHFSLPSFYNMLSENGFSIDTIFYMRRFIILAVVSLKYGKLEQYSYDDLTIIIPTLNAEKNISRILLFLINRYPGVKIIVSDNESCDGTKKIVNSFSDKNVILLDKKEKDSLGLTDVIFNGINSAKTPYFIVVESDLEYPLEKIIEIYNMLKLDYDLAIGTRVSVKNWNTYNMLTSFIATALGKTSLLIRGKRHLTYDILSGFWGGNVDSSRKLMQEQGARFQKNGRKILFDFLKVAPKSKVIGEVFYEFKSTSGELKIRLTEIIAYLKSLFI